jgi:hypothetical protein
MASHFSSIGVLANTEDEISELLDKIWDESEAIDCEYGYYAKFSSKTGAELWVHVDKCDKIIGVNPFYNGESNFLVGITKQIKNKQYNKFECLFYAWTNPENDNPETGYYPFAFDCVNIAVAPKIELPCITHIKLSAFAHELEIYKSEEDYDLWQKKIGKDDLRLASKSFIPSGLFSANDKKDVSPRTIPEAVFTGVILDYKKHKNELTGESYFWIKTETYGGIIDVVADPSLINEKLEKNGVISGEFYLCGKLIF